MVRGMSAALSRRRPPIAPAFSGTAFVAAWAGALAAGLALSAAAVCGPAHVPFAALASLAAAGWAWTRLDRPWRGWVAAAPLAAWTIGAFGWTGATAVAGTLWAALALLPRETRTLSWEGARRPGRSERPGRSFTRDRPGDEPSTDPLESEFAEEDGAIEEDDADEQPDQWFARTESGGVVTVAGELTIACEHGVGSGHVLFWPAFAGPPRVIGHSADGVGRVRAARVLPQGVRFELNRPDGGTGPVRVCYEAIG